MDYFTASDGARIFYRDEGRGRPLVLLHGLMANGDFFREQLALSDDFRLVRIDLRGHGASLQPGDRPQIGRLAADVAELVEALKLEAAIGIGWSLGATILWHLLTGPSAPRFAGAVVVDMTARVLNGADWSLGLSAEACEARTQAIRNDFASFAAAAGQAIFAQPIKPPHRETATWSSAQFVLNDPEAIASVWASLVEEDVRPRLQRIEHPTLVVHGAQSSLYGEETAGHLISALPNAEAVRFEGSGHAPHIEEAGRFNRLIKQFADRLPAVRTHHNAQQGS